MKTNVKGARCLFTNIEFKVSYRAKRHSVTM